MSKYWTVKYKVLKDMIFDLQPITDCGMLFAYSL